jgi:hypothetical protein
VAFASTVILGSAAERVGSDSRANDRRKANGGPPQKRRWSRTSQYRESVVRFSRVWEGSPQSPLARAGTAAEFPRISRHRPFNIAWHTKC